MYSKTFAIALREIKSVFDSLTGYVLASGFLLITGLFTWFFGSHIFLVNRASLDAFFNSAFLTLFFFIPAITMKAVSEEKKTGTLELIFTKSVREIDFILGKYFGVTAVILIMLLLTIPYAVTLYAIGNPDTGTLISGYSGTVLISLVFGAIGIFCGTFSNNQVTSYLLSLLAGVFFIVIFESLGGLIKGPFGEFFYYLSLNTHYNRISRGIIDLSALIYFLALIVWFLGISSLILSERNFKAKQKPEKLRTLLKVGTFSLFLIIACTVFYYSGLRIDFTEDQRYTLSSSTENLLKKLDEEVKITAFISEDIPPGLTPLANDMQSILEKYSELSSGKVRFSIVRPGTKEEDINKAVSEGMLPMVVSTEESNQLKQQQIFLGASVEASDKKEVIAAIGPGAPMEYEFTTIINKLVQKNKKKIGIPQGKGEIIVGAVQQLFTELELNYEVKTILISDSVSVPSDISAVFLISPSAPLTEGYLNNLNSYLERGGRLFLAHNAVAANYQTAEGYVVNTNINELLKKWGMQIEDKFVTDANCGKVNVRQQHGLQTYNIPVNFPYYPIITDFADHSTAAGADNILLPFASPVNIINSDSLISVTPVAFTSQKSGVEEAPTVFNLDKQWQESDFRQSMIPVAAVSERKSEFKTSRIFVISDADFIINGDPSNPQELPKGNIKLALSAADWLTDTEGFSELRSKGLSIRFLDPSLTNETKNILKYLNLIFPVIIVVIAGVIRFSQLRKKRRYNPFTQTSGNAQKVYQEEK